jgi:hypothetical protein
MVETTVPRFIHIPLVLFDRIRREGHPLMPHKVLTFIMQHVEASPQNQAAEVGQAWQLMVQWRVVAAQQDSQSDSLVAFSVKAITETDDTCFCQWAKNCLDGTMGVKSSMPAPTVMPLGGAHTQVHGQFAAELGRGVALGLQAFGPLRPLVGHPGENNENDSKQLHGEEDIVALMGFSHVRKGSDLIGYLDIFPEVKRKKLGRMSQATHGTDVTLGTRPPNTN